MNPIDLIVTAARTPPELSSQVLRKVVVPIAVVGIVVGILAAKYWPLLALSSQMALLFAALCFTPPIVARLLPQKDLRAARMAVTCTIFTVELVLFAVWLYGTRVVGGWILSLAAIIFVLGRGGAFIGWQIDRTVDRLSNNLPMEVTLQAVQSMFRREGILYISIPVGLAIGLLYGIITGRSSTVVAQFCAQAVLWLAAALLLVFLVRGCLRIVRPAN